MYRQSEKKRILYRMTRIYQRTIETNQNKSKHIVAKHRTHCQKAQRTRNYVHQTNITEVLGMDQELKRLELQQPLFDCNSLHHSPHIKYH